MIDLEQKLRVFLASSPSRIRRVETLQLYHPNFTKTFHLWKEPYLGTTKYYNESDVLTTANMQPLNFKVSKGGSQANLDQKMTITIDVVDVEDEFREQMNRIPLSSEVPVYIWFREYLSDDLNNPQSEFKVQVESVTYSLGVATLQTVVPRLNTTRTGITYNTRDVPMLRGFL